MKCDDMFSAYRMLSPDTPDYSHAFFSEAVSPYDILHGLVERVFIPARIFEKYGEELPGMGDVMCVTDEEDNALCLIKITAVRVGLFSDGKLLYDAAPDETGAALTFKVVFS